MGGNQSSVEASIPDSGRVDTEEGVGDSAGKLAFAAVSTLALTSGIL